MSNFSPCKQWCASCHKATLRYRRSGKCASCVVIRANYVRTPEWRSEFQRRGVEASHTPELNSARAHKRWDAMTPEQRREAMREIRRAMTPEQQRDAARKAAAHPNHVASRELVGYAGGRSSTRRNIIRKRELLAVLEAELAQLTG